MTRFAAADRVVRRLGRLALPEGALRRLRSGRRTEPWVDHDWRWSSPAELAGGIDIAQLVSPLRYDVLVRRDFLGDYARGRDAYRDDPARLLERARASDYHTWFIESEAVRTGLARRHERADLEALFVERVRRAADLYERLARRDGQLDEPILLKTARTLLPPTTDRLGPPGAKVLERRYFLADGCHRLAVLMLAGRTELRPGEFRVREYRTFSPFDSTSLLVGPLDLPAARYFEFLSLGYTAPQVFSDGRSFLAHLREGRPGSLAEAVAVIRADGYAAAAGLGS